jgi:hypothetical protein
MFLFTCLSDAVHCWIYPDCSAIINCIFIFITRQPSTTLKCEKMENGDEKILGNEVLQETACKTSFTDLGYQMYGFFRILSRMLFALK